MVWSRQDEPAAMTSRKGVGVLGGRRGQRVSSKSTRVRSRHSCFVATGRARPLQRSRWAQMMHMSDIRVHGGVGTPSDARSEL